MVNERFESFLEKIQEIPTLPDVVIEVMRMMRDPDVTAAQVNEVISQDAALTGNILKLCNSAYYGLPRLISSVTQAITYLGLYTVRNLILTCAMRDFFGSDSPIYGYTENGLRLHSIASAVASQRICEKVRPGMRDTAFTAGLLQDIGKVIIHEATKDTEISIVALMVDENLPLTDAERSVLGFTHAELGAELARRWNFPSDLVHAFRYHHDPSQAPQQSILTCITHLADTFVLEKRIGVELDKLIYSPSPDALQQAGLDRDDLEALMDGFDESFQEMIQLFESSD